jgi:hypothetical protein
MDLRAIITLDAALPSLFSEWEIYCGGWVSWMGWFLSISFWRSDIPSAMSG